ncbi:MAG: hemerythrin domain-containing protein [Gammaproteobacteria bacterium]|nr:hemerythrin domain-containing protein [Gammaproteobacteria bacterium]
MSIAEFMRDDHKHCDALFAAAEGMACRGDWLEVQRSSDNFIHRTERHFSLEEEILFPRFEEVSGMPQGGSAGPTAMMRSEHQQMRGLFVQLLAAVTAKDSEAFLGVSETLLLLMQQHNAKEEQILYVMMDRVLADEEQSLLLKLQMM